MADDELVLDPSGSGPMVKLPDAPGNFSETVPNLQTQEEGKKPDPFTPLTPQQAEVERNRLRFQAGFRGTVAGAGQAAGLSAVADRPAFMPAPQGPELPAPEGTGMEEIARDQLENIVADQLAYKQMPASKVLSAEGVLGGSIHLMGASLSPEMWVFPYAKVMSPAFQAAHPLISSMVGYGLGQAAVGGVTDAAKQALELKAGLRESFDPTQLSWSIPIGFAFGAAAGGLGHAGSALFRSGVNETKEQLLGAVPRLAPEVKPRVEPSKELAPKDTFEFAAPPKVPGAEVTQDIARALELPPLQEGNVRLWRDASPGDGQARSLLFSRTQFPNAREFIDVPEDVAASMTHGDRVVLPMEVAQARAKLPQSAGEAAAETRAKEIIDELRSLGTPEADNYAKGIETRFTGRMRIGVKESDIPFMESRLLEFRQQAGMSGAEALAEDITLRSMIRPAQHKHLDNPNLPEDIKATIAKAQDAFEEAVGLVNQNGFKLSKVHEVGAAAPEQAREAAKLAQGLAGRTYRLANGLQKAAKGKQAGFEEGFASKRVQEDIADLKGDFARLEEIKTMEGSPKTASGELLPRGYRIHRNKDDGLYEVYNRRNEFVSSGADEAEAVQVAIDDLKKTAERLGEKGIAEQARVNANSAAENRTQFRMKGMAGQGITPPPRRGPGAGVASANVKADLGPIGNLQDLMRNVVKQINEALGADISKLAMRTGVHERGALAQYNFETHIGRLGDLGPKGYIDFWHEVGHHIENVGGTDLKRLIADNPESMRAFAGVMGEHLPEKLRNSEGFAEFLAAYASERANIEMKDPRFARLFRETMAQNNPKVLEAIDNAHDGYLKYDQAPSRQRVQSQIISHGDVPPMEEGNPLKMGAVGRWFDWFTKKQVDEDLVAKQWERKLFETYEKLFNEKMDIEPQNTPTGLLKMFKRGGATKTANDIEFGFHDFDTLEAKGPALKEIMRKVTADMDGREAQNAAQYNTRKTQFESLAVAVWHKELRRQISNGEIDLLRPPTGLTDGEAETTIRELLQLRPDWEVYLEEIYALNKEIVKFKYKAGLVTEDDLAFMMMPKNHKYIPLNRDMRGITDAMFGGQGGSFLGGKGLESLGRFRRTGSERAVKSPIEQIILQMYQANDQAASNMVITAMADLLRTVGGPEAAALGNFVPSKTLRGITLDMEQELTKFAMANGWLARDAKNMANSMIQEVGPNTKLQIWRQQDKNFKGKPVIFGWEAGERIAIEMPSTEFGWDLVRLADSMGPHGMRMWSQATGLLFDLAFKSSQTLRSGATGTFTWMAKNLVRDSFMQYMMVPETTVGTLFGKSIMKGLKSYVTKDEFYQAYMTLEGIEGGAVTSQLGASAKGRLATAERIMGTRSGILGGTGINPRSLQKARVEAAAEMERAGVEAHKQVYFGTWKEFWSKVEISETVGRLGLFRQIMEANLKSGKDWKYAAFDAAQKARDFVDYGTHGSRTELTTRAVPFLNSNVNGLHKFVRTYIGTETSPGLVRGVPVTKQQEEYQKMIRMQLGSRAITLATLSGGLAAIYYDDPVFQRISEQVRAQYWVIPAKGLMKGVYDMLGGGTVEFPDGTTGAYVMIPKPWEPGTIFNLAERIVQFMMTQDPDHLKKAWNSMRYTFNVPMEIPFFRVMNGLSSNYDDFKKGPIVPERFQHMEPHMQATEYTGWFYKSLAEALAWAANSVGVSPLNAQKAIRQGEIPLGGTDTLAIPIISPIIAQTIGPALAAPWSPLQNKYLMEGVFGDWPRELGGIGGIARSLFGAVQSGLTGTDNQYPFKIDDVPVLRAFIKTKMAAGEPMQELFLQTGQNGRLSIAKNTFQAKNKNDPAAAMQYYSALDQDQRDYVRLRDLDPVTKPEAKVINPWDRMLALHQAVSEIKRGVAEGTIQKRDGSGTIKLDPVMRDNILQQLNEYVATQARNTSVVMGTGGFKNVAITKDFNLDVVKAMSPEVFNELSVRLASHKVLPMETIQRYWPQVQRLIREGEGPIRGTLAGEVNTLVTQAAFEGFEGGGMKLGRRATDAEGNVIKKGKRTPTVFPAEGVRP